MIKRIINRLHFLWRGTRLGRVKKNPNAIKWGIIGTGYMSDTFGRAIMESRDDVIYAVSSRSLKKASVFAKRHGNAKSFGSIEDFLKDREIDIVYIATPVECHYKNIKDCLEAGYNVLCEKPLTLKYEEASELFALAKKKELLLLEGMWMHCLPTMKKARHWIDSGDIGKIEYIQVQLSKQVNHEHVRKHLGVLYDYGIYPIAFVNQFFNNKIDKIADVCRKNQDGYITDISLLLKLGEIGASISINSNLQSESKAVIIGSKGTIEWNSPFNRSNTITKRTYGDDSKEVFSTKYINEGFEYELSDVGRCLRSHLSVSPELDKEMTLHCLQIIEKILSDEIQ